jgi:DEAD/DEAH box helicase domain-containing protein
MTEVYYDVETQKSAEEVGGWNNKHLMLISVAVTYDDVHQFQRWEESKIPEMMKFLVQHDRIISFNGDGFDSHVLTHYGNVSLINKKSFDVMRDLKRLLGHRIGLDAVAHATLGIGKTADGLQAIQWFKEGKIDEIAAYCQKDVEVLKNIVAYGRQHKCVYYFDFNRGKRRVNVEW